MSTLTILMLGLTVGLPCTVLALAIVYHARIAMAARMPAADEGWDPRAEDDAYGFAPFDADADGAPAFSVPTPDFAPAVTPEPPVATYAAEPDPALVALQQTVVELQQQLAGQRAAVAGLLSGRERAPEPARTAAEAPEVLAVTDLSGAVRRLHAEGLSERSIARRLHVGLEEVRLVSRRERVS